MILKWDIENDCEMTAIDCDSNAKIFFDYAG